MASKRGGYRRPSESQSYSGVGKNSRRTDTQAVRAPNVQDSEDLQVGDRERIRQGQNIVPLGRVSSPRVAAPPRSGSPSSAAGGGAVLPDHLMGLPSTRPGEDEMTPASAPPVEPEDDMEVVLQFLIDNFGDAHAERMLNEHRATKVAPESPLSQPMPEVEVPRETQDIEPEPSSAFDVEKEPMEEEDPSLL